MFVQRKIRLNYKSKNTTNTYVHNHLTKIQLTGAVKVFVLHIVYENTIILYKVRYFSPNEGQY
jgi:hypothetical protein